MFRWKNNFMMKDFHYNLVHNSEKLEALDLKSNNME